MTWRMTSLAAAAVALLGLSAACGGDDNTSTPTPRASSSGTAATAAPSNSDIPAGAPEVDQNNLAFKPDKLTVKVGEKVYFKNSESALHTVTINTKNVSGNMKKGDVVVWVPPTAGTYTITCDFHPQMNAKITAS